MSRPGDATPATPGPLWRCTLLPLWALLGAILPLAFFAQIEDFLFYVRPAELLPAYGTAWLLTAALALPLWLIVVLLTQALWRLSGRRLWLERTLDGLTAALTAAAVVFCLLVWLQTFGALRRLSFRHELFWPVLLVAGILGATRAGALRVERLRTLLGTVSIVGALCALTIPLFGWSHDARSTHFPGTAPAADPAAGTSPAGDRPRAPHIVLLSIDALSAQHMSLYGAVRPTTPMLSSFAQGATTFEHAYADANFTTPGVSSILTGTRPWLHRALQLQAWPESDERARSLPALLQLAGYQTGYVSTNAVAGAAKNGFNRYFDFAVRDRIHDVNLCTDGLSARFKYACAIADMPLFGALVALADQLSGGRDNAHYDPRLATGPALAWLQQVDKSRPVFLWVHLFPPHSPYAAPAPWLGRFDSSAAGRNVGQTEPYWGYTLGTQSPAEVQLLNDRYDEAVLYVDHYAGQFLQQALQILGANTAVVVTADHGESFHHGYGAHTGIGLFDEIIHVPLIVKLPGQTQPLASSSVVEQVDIAPTLAQLAGISAPPSWEGRSLLGVWGYAGSDPLPVKPAFSMNFEQTPRHGALSTGSVAVIDGSWKLVHYIGHPHYPDMPALHDALYDLAGDPGETKNLIASQPEEAARLRALIDAQLARYGHAE
jgi:arylsulfatase A-like enzyme